MLTVGRPTTWSHHNQADEDWSGLLLGVGVSTPICKASKLRRWRREALVVQESLEGAAQNSALPKSMVRELCPGVWPREGPQLGENRGQGRRTGGSSGALPHACSALRSLCGPGRLPPLAGPGRETLWDAGLQAWSWGPELCAAPPSVQRWLLTVHCLQGLNPPNPPPRPCPGELRPGHWLA